MPYMMVKQEDGQYCVFKKGPDGKPTGPKKGGPFSEEEAKKQLAALYANMKDETKSILEKITDGFKGLVDFIMGSEVEEEGDAEAGDKSSMAVPPKKGEPKSEGKLPDEDEAHISDAITALSPGGFRGNPVKLSPEQRKAAIAKLGSKIDSLNIPPEKKAHLHERLNAVKEAPFELGFKIIGNHWFGAWTNNFEDRIKQLFSLKAIDNFIEEANKNPENMPELWAWHKAAPLGKAEMVGRIGHIVIAVGKFYDQKDYVKEFIKNQPLRAEKDGMSHGYWYYKDQLDKTGVYHQFKTFEITVLPKEYAANPYTSFGIKGEGEAMLTDAQKAYFREVFGDKADAYMAEVEKKSDELDGKGIRSKELETGADEVLAQVKTLTEAVATLTKENTDLKKAVEEGLKANNEKYGLIENFLKFQFQTKDLASHSKETEVTPENNPALKDLKDKQEAEKDKDKGEKDFTYTFMPFLKPQS